MATKAEDLQLGTYKYGWHDNTKPVIEPKRGLSEDVVREISALKNEPKWMLDMRLKAYRHFVRRPMPTWGGDLSGIDFDNIYYFVRSTEKQATTWDELPEDIKNTYDKLGIPEAEKQRLIAGVAAQYECLVGDTRVYTANRGVVAIKEIEPGDRVFAFDEQASELTVAPVRAAAQTDVRQTYRVTVGDRLERTIVGTDNHPVLSLVEGRGGRHELRWKTIGELRAGDMVAVARDLPDFGAPHAFATTGSTPATFPETSDADVAWLLGYWFSAGVTDEDPERGTWLVEFAVAGDNTAVRAEITRILAERFGVRSTSLDDTRVSANSRPLTEWMAANGLIGDEHARRIPAWVYTLPADQRRAFLGGIVDARGDVAPITQSGAVAINSRSTVKLSDVMELAELTGLRPAGPYPFAAQAEPQDVDGLVEAFQIVLDGDSAALGVRAPQLRASLAERARSGANGGDVDADLRPHTGGHLAFAEVTSIEEAEVVPVYDIEIDGPHNFVAEGVVVHNSEVVYHKVREDLEAQGVIFLDTDTGLKEHEDIFREHFGTIIPPNDNKFAALNTAVWSGGSFIVVPEGVKVDIPLQAYFRINQQNMGQFERTLIIAEPGSYVHYVEGCTAPIYSSDSLHSAVVELIAKPGARLRYTTIQNWSNNVYNLVTKRAAAYEDATVEWIDGNIGSKLTMKYPSVYLMGRGAHGEVLSVAFAGDGQHQDAGAKMHHYAPDTTSTILSKSVSQGRGRTSYRGQVEIAEGAHRVKNSTICDALLLDETSRSDTYPYMNINEEDATIAHEASVSKVGEEQLFYLMSRGIDEAEANAMIVRGFIEPIAKELPMEYSVELNRLISLNMAGAVG